MIDRMMKQPPINITNYKLDHSFYEVHKDASVPGDFGLDNTSELIEKGFGLYSSAGLKPKIGPIKSEFFRIGFGVKGYVDIHCGLETFHFTPGCIAFTFPGQIFSLHDKSADLFVYYMLFTEDFIADVISLKNMSRNFPFLNYAGIQSFQLETKNAKEIQSHILKINEEIKRNAKDLKQSIQLYIQLILLEANRSYEILNKHSLEANHKEITLVRDYKKLVSNYFITKRKVSDYADLLHITPAHLNKVVKRKTDKTAHELIDEMLLLEAKALIRHTNKSIAEIAYDLDFSDPSHFNKFFKKLSGITPLQYRIT